MKLKKLPPECVAPLRLKEITLHGIGSYLRPARLEIRPLTVLCGNNGVGKSTWIKVLDALCGACESDRFPFDLLPSTEVHGIGLVNTIVQNMDDKDWPPCDWDHAVGPLGTVGVVFDCVKAMDLGVLEYPIADGIDASLLAFLHHGTLKRGDVVTVRVTHQIAEPGRDLSRRFFGFRVCVNDHGLEYRSSLEQSGPQSSLHAIELGRRDGRSSSRPAFDDDNRIDLSDAFLGECGTMLGERMRVLVRLWSESFFRIKAIRHVQEIPECWYPNSNNPGAWTAYRERKPSKQRYVGPHGECAQLLRTSATTLAMLDPRQKNPYVGIPGATYYSDECEPVWLLKSHIGWNWLFEHAPTACESIVQFFHENADQLPKEHRSLCRLAEVLAGPISDRDKKLAEICSGLGATAPSANAFWPSPITQNDEPDVEAPRMEESPSSAIEDMIRSAISSETISWESYFGLHDPDPTSLRSSFGKVFEGLGVALRSEPDLFWLLLRIVRDDPSNAPIKEQDIPRHLLFLANVGRDELHEADRRYLDAWAWGVGQVCDWMSGSVLFDTVYGEWVRRLFGIKVLESEYDIDLASAWPKDGPGPTGILFPEKKSMYIVGSGPDAVQNHRSHFFPDDWGVDPTNFSSGFHQVAPVLIQFGLMRMNELCTVENPEVHLHPGLQLMFTEFFIENAKIGKFSILETHSDLVVRRIYRAIRAEEIRQGWVGINFVHEEEAPEYRTKQGDGPHTSVLKPWQHDEKGGISNWPKGFLQDDVEESKELLRAMYGGTEEIKTRGDEQ